MNVSKKFGPEADTAGLSRSVRDCLNSGVVVVDGRKKIRAWTAGVERLTGIASQDALNHDFKLLPAALRRIVASISKSGKAIKDRRITLVSTLGSKNTIRVEASLLQSGTKSSGVLLVLNEVTPMERFQENLHRLDRLATIGTLSAGMAHEIKNALVAVKTFIDLLLEKNRDAELADVVRREMGRINSLVSQTVKFSGPARPAFTVLRLHELLEHSLRLVQPQMDKKIISVNRQFNASPDTIRGDDYQLEQVFVNFLLNAIEAMGASGSLTITTSILSASGQENTSAAAESYVQVSIADTGVGIAQENMAHLFEPFFTTKENGTGLGLVIARRIVEEHRGSIEVQSQVNQGTTFTVRFPALTYGT